MKARLFNRGVFVLLSFFLASDSISIGGAEVPAEGYLTLTVNQGLHLIASPFKRENWTVKDLIPTPPEGTELFQTQPMKPFCFAMVSGLLSISAQAQGTINFATGAAGVDAPVKLAPGGVPLEGAAWRAELLWVSADGRLTPVGEPVLFGANEVAGYFFGGLVSVPGAAIGQKATFQIRVFETGGASEAISNPVRVTLGGDKIPPANLVGLQSWTVNLAHKSVLRISGSAAGIKLSWAKETAAVTVESTESLAEPKWNTIAPPPILVGDEWTVTVSPDASARYYRLRLR